MEGHLSVCLGGECSGRLFLPPIKGRGVMLDPFLLRKGGGVPPFRYYICLVNRGKNLPLIDHWLLTFKIMQGNSGQTNRNPLTVAKNETLPKYKIKVVKKL